MTLHWGDAHEGRPRRDAPAPGKVVANLPYGVAAGALLRTIEELPGVERWVAMVQREVGERLAAAPGGRVYGVPSVLAQLTCEVRVARAVARTVFRPVPNVDSVLVLLTRRAAAPAVDAAAADARRRRLRAPPQDARALARAGRRGAARPQLMIAPRLRRRGRARRARRARPPARRARRAALAVGLPRAGRGAGDMTAVSHGGPTPTGGDGLTGGRGLPLHASAPAKINLGLFLGPRPRGRSPRAGQRDAVDHARRRAHAARRAGTARTATSWSARACRAPRSRTSRRRRSRRSARRPAGRRAPLELRIDKRVPVAAGLGGGSGDAAAALRLAAAASGLGGQALLHELARGLGADVPAQVRPGRWLARGAGELLHELPPPRAPFGVLVLPAAAALSTAAVYAQADRIGAARGADELQELHGALARELADGAALPAADLLANDLQDAARVLCPAIDAALDQARVAGADVALLSGSGPTVLGLFAGPDGPARAIAAAGGLAGERAAAGLPAALAAEPVGADLPIRHNSPA